MYKHANADAQQTYTDVCRCMQTNPDKRRRTQTNTRQTADAGLVHIQTLDVCSKTFVMHYTSLSPSHFPPPFLPFVLFLLSLSSPVPQQSQCLMTHTLTDYLECEEDVVTQKGKKMTICSQLLKNAYSCTCCAACLRNCSSFTMFSHVCLCVFVS